MLQTSLFEREIKKGTIFGQLFAWRSFAYSEAACSQEFRAEPRCSFAFVLLSSGSEVEREFNAPLLFP